MAEISTGGGRDFRSVYSGRLFGVLSWAQLENLWRLIDPSAGWFLYAVGELPPVAVSSQDAVRAFMKRADALLRSDHQQDYCGIVYVDDMASPTFVKIYDPNNLGVSCGFSSNPPLPGWIMSRMPPEDISRGIQQPAGRRRWWQALLGQG